MTYNIVTKLAFAVLLALVFFLFISINATNPFYIADGKWCIPFFEESVSTCIYTN